MGWGQSRGVIFAFFLLTLLPQPLLHTTVFEFMPYMGITLATIFTMLRLVNEAKMRQVICGGTCSPWACRSGPIRVLEGKMG